MNKNARANARLIAAAPDLLAACKEAREALHNLRHYWLENDCCNGTPHDEDCSCTLHKLRAAIAKATK